MAVLSATSTRSQIERMLIAKGFKYQYGHYYLGIYRFQMRPASVALTNRIKDTKLWRKRGWWYYGQINLEEFGKLADSVVAAVQRANEKARQANPQTGGLGVTRPARVLIPSV